MSNRPLTHAEQTLSETLDRETALRYIEDKEEWKRAIGIARLSQLGETVADEILAKLRDEASKRRRKSRLVHWGFGIYGAVLVIGLLTWIGIGAFTGRWADFPWQLFQVFSYMGIMGSVGAANHFQKSANQVIAGLDDVKYVPILVDHLEYNDKHMTEVSRAALTNLLPRISASDSDLLNDAQRKLLHRALIANNYRYPMFDMAYLKAMEQVGDERDLPTLQKVANRDAKTERARELQAAIRDALAFVEQRAEKNRVANTLLRASSGADDSAELLRPITPAVSESASLLRASIGSESPPQTEYTQAADSEVQPFQTGT